MDRLLRTMEELSGLSNDGEMRTIDRWLLSRINNRITSVKEGMGEYDLRRMANEVYFETFTDARWYMRRGGANSDVISRLMSIWIRMMSPITPHTAEELWESRGEKGFVSIAPYPECDRNYIDPKAEIAEQYLESVLGDINEILRVTGISPGSVHIYTTPDWKRRVLSLAIEMARSKQLNVPSLTKRTMSDNDMKKLGKEASDFARRTAEELMKRSEAELDRMSIDPR